MRSYVTKIVAILFIVSIVVSNTPYSAMAENTSRSPITYNRHDPVWWDGSGAGFILLDYNDDGIIDMRLGDYIYENMGTNLAPLFLESGAGIKLNLPLGGNGYMIDFNHDSVLDFISKEELILYINTGTDKAPVWVEQGLLQAGSSTMKSDYSSFISYSTTSSPNMVMADWDNDGLDDLMVSVFDRVVATENGIQKNVHSQGRVFFYKNTGTNQNPTFAQGQRLQNNGADLNFPYRQVMDIIDYDNDGDLEIITVGYNSKVWLTEKDTSAVDCKPQVLLFEEGYEMFSPDHYDLDGDSDLDMVVHSSCGLYLYEKTDSGYKYLNQAKVADGLNTSLRADIFLMPTVVDWENDGDLDLVAGSENGYIYLFENVGSNENKQFKDAVRIMAGGKVIDFNSLNGSYRWGLGERAVGYPNPVFVDWDQDGDLDLITQDAEISNLHYFENIGTRSNPVYASDVIFTLNGQPLVHPWRTRPAIVDYDNDGKLDIVMVNYDMKMNVYTRKDNSLLDLRFIGNVMEVTEQPIVMPTNMIDNGMAQAQAIDWDGDGLFDLLAGVGLGGASNSDYDRIHFLKNVGTPGNPVFIHRFIKNKDLTDFQSIGDHEPHYWAVDWNQDGKLDLIDAHPHPRSEADRHALYLIDGVGLHDYSVGDPEDVEPDYGTNIAPYAISIEVDSNYNLAYKKEKAIDGNKYDASSRWLSGGTTDQHYFQLTWDEKKWINRVSVWSGNAAEDGLSGSGWQIDSYTIDYWNGESWVVAASVTGNDKDASIGEYNDLPFAEPVFTDKIRINITNACVRTDKKARLVDFEVHTSNIDPKAMNVKISGLPYVGSTLTGEYTYTDAEGDPESESIYDWLSSDQLYGVYSTVSGAVYRNYTLQLSDAGRYFKFTVRPKSQGATGRKTMSKSSPKIGFDDAYMVLSDLKVNGITVDGFESSKQTYSVILPSGSTIPEVSAAVPHDDLAVSVVQPTRLNGTSVITVTAMDGTYRTYTVNFVPAEEAGLIVELLSFKNSEGYLVSQLEPNEIITAQIRINNGTAGNLPIYVNMVLFNKDNQIVQNVSMSKLAEKYQIETLETSMKLPENLQGCYIKVFMWNTKAGMSPWSKVVRFP